MYRNYNLNFAQADRIWKQISVSTGIVGTDDCVIELKDLASHSESECLNSSQPTIRYIKSGPNYPPTAEQNEQRQAIATDPSVETTVATVKLKASVDLSIRDEQTLLSYKGASETDGDIGKSNRRESCKVLFPENNSNDKLWLDVTYEDTGSMA